MSEQSERIINNGRERGAKRGGRVVSGAARSEAPR
jgi:hypothetical protein